jgi:hypothetical protein
MKHKDLEVARDIYEFLAKPSKYYVCGECLYTLGRAHANDCKKGVANEVQQTT